MKRTSVVCLVLLAGAVAASAQHAAPRKVLLPFAFSLTDWGYIDRTGAPVSAARYESASDFSEGLAAVADADRLWGYVDESERWVVPPRFTDAEPFSEGLAAVQMEKGGPWGYIDASGRVVIPAQYNLARAFQGGFAPVRNGAVTQLIDKTGRVLVPPVPWVATEGFSEGLAVASAPGQAGFMDPSGRIAITVPGSVFAQNFSEGLAAVQIGFKYGYIDTSGKVVIAPAYDSASAFHEKRAAVRISDKWGYIDEQGRLVVRVKYDHAGDFSQGLAPVGQGGREAGSVAAWRYIDPSGKTVIPAAYSIAGPFVDGIARVGVGEMVGQEQYFYIDDKGLPLPKLSVVASDIKTDFSGAGNDFNLPTSGNWKTGGGVYSNVSDGQGWSLRQADRLVPPDFYAEVKLLSQEGEDAQSGLAFKVNVKDGSFYYFGLTGLGCSVQFRGKDAKWEMVAAVKAVVNSGANTLAVAVRGEIVDCFLNGTRAITFVDNRIGELYRHIGLFVSSSKATSFDDLSVRAIGRQERLGELDSTPPQPEEAYALLDAQLSGFPDSSLRLFAPPNPSYSGELYLSFDGLGTGGYQMQELSNQYGELDFRFVGQAVYKDIGQFYLQFPVKMPTDDSGTTKLLDARAYVPRFFFPQLATYGSMSAADLTAARASSPQATRAIDLAVFLRDWKSYAVEVSLKAQDIQLRNRWVAFEDFPGIMVGVVDLGGIIAALWGLIDWGINGSFGQRQSLEVWGGLGAMAAANLLYLPYGFLIAKPIAERTVERKLSEMRKAMDAKFKALADAMRARYPEAMVEGRPDQKEK